MVVVVSGVAGRVGMRYIELYYVTTFEPLCLCVYSLAQLQQKTAALEEQQRELDKQLQAADWNLATDSE